MQLKFIIRAAICAAVLHDNIATAAIGVLAGVQLTPFLGYKFGSEYLYNNSVTYGATLSRGNSALGTETGKNLDISVRAKIFPTEGSWYVSGGLNQTQATLSDPAPAEFANMERVSANTKIEKRALEIGAGHRWFFKDYFSLDVTWIGVSDP